MVAESNLRYSSHKDFMGIFTLPFSFSDDAEFLWRLARACRDLSLLSHVGAEQKKQLTYEALEYASRALEKNDACFAAHKVPALMNSSSTVCSLLRPYSQHVMPVTVVCVTHPSITVSGGTYRYTFSVISPARLSQPSPQNSHYELLTLSVLHICHCPL